MSRSLCTWRASTVFLLPEARVMGLVPRSSCGPSRWYTGRVVAGLCEHPGAEDSSQAGLGGDDLSVRVLPEIGVHLPLQGFDLLVQRDQDRDQGTHRGGVGGRHNIRLAQVGGVQRSRIRSVFAAMPRRRARLSAALICAVVSFAADAGSGARASSSRVSAASRSSNASSAAGK